MHFAYCVFSECENRMSVQFCLCVASRGESVVIVVGDDIFLSRCLTVALPCSVEGSECHRESLVPVGLSCVGAVHFGGTKFLTLWMRGLRTYCTVLCGIPP